MPIIISILIGIVALFAVRRRQKEIKKTGKYPEGHWMNRGIAIGICLGIPIGVAIGNIALGSAIGVVMGAAIGAALKSKQ